MQFSWLSMMNAPIFITFLVSVTEQLSSAHLLEHLDIFIWHETFGIADYRDRTAAQV